MDDGRVARAMREFITTFIEEEDGQAISEYGAVLAFTALLIGTFFHVSTGPYSEILNTTYHRISSSLVALAAQPST